MRNKVFFIMIFFLFILTGCELNNNPTSKVEELLGNYQELSKDVIYNYADLSGEVNLNQDIISSYNDLIRKQYRHLSYEIKEESVDGDIATITTEIEVLDYKSVIDNYAAEDTTSNSVHEEIIEKLKNVKDNVTYTIDFTVTRDTNGKWVIDELDLEQHQKLLGIY